ncbi:MAG: hypothetical protein FWF76_07850 [Oscillospiraceae bacterium]|nr:hypothetical protein [Oscillospiraceae bacterium]
MEKNLNFNHASDADNNHSGDFKTLYKKDIELIKPSDEFLESLKTRLNQEIKEIKPTRNVHKSRDKNQDNALEELKPFTITRRSKFVWSSIAAVACVIIVGIVYLINLSEFGLLFEGNVVLLESADNNNTAFDSSDSKNPENYSGFPTSPSESEDFVPDDNSTALTGVENGEENNRLPTGDDSNVLGDNSDVLLDRYPPPSNENEHQRLPLFFRLAIERALRSITTNQETEIEEE